MKVIVHESASAVAAAAAALIVDELSVPGPTTLGLAGGGTPAGTYALLSGAAIDWNRVTLWLGDERWVPGDHPNSNARMAREHLGPAASARILAPQFGADPHAAAADYESRLRAAFEGTGSRPGTVLLGIGNDGHTASLFPGSQALEERERLYVANRVDSFDAWRLTATIPLLSAARHLVFLATGEGKAPILSEILNGAVSYPARIVAEQAGAATWMVDAAAASLLGPSRPS